MLQTYLERGRIEAGCDEAGRGCLAGPVFAAAVILPPDFRNELLNDSKQLTERQRYELRPIIEREAVAWAVGTCDNHEIDRYNILRCSIMAMHRALDQLKVRPDFILVDGNRFLPYGDTPYQTIVHGDAKMMSIAAASILAKTYRDDYMNEQAKIYPQYHWEVNKGYPTKDHRLAIAQYGACPLHRETFALLPKSADAPKQKARPKSSRKKLDDKDQLSLFGLLLMVLLLLPATAAAWNPFKTFNKVMNYFDSLPPSYDTTYIYQPKNHWLIEPSIGLEGSNVIIEKATPHGFTINPVEMYHNIEAIRNAKSEYKVSLHTYPMPTLALRLKYRLIDFTFFSIQPKIFSSSNLDYRWKFGLNFNRMGVNLIYQHTRSFHGNYKASADSLAEDINVDLGEGVFREKLFEVTAYYVFNTRRFSYLAAIDQTQEQLKSAGSWMLGLTFTNDRIAVDSDTAGRFSMQFVQVALGGGYAYNWVVHHWLLHFKALPQIVVYPYYKMEEDGLKRSIDRDGFDFVLPLDISAVRYWRRSYFAFSSGAETIIIGSADDRQITNIHWRARIAYGIRF